MELHMTTLQIKLITELVTWVARAFFDAVQDDENCLTADQAKQLSNKSLSNLTVEVSKAIIENVPRNTKL